MKNSKIDHLFQDRLKMQTVKRYLAGFDIPADFDFLKSKDFVDKFYKNWPLFRKKSFVKMMVGPFIQNCQKLEKELEALENK